MCMIDNNNGKLFVFEGLDGCGKTTQLKMIADRLNALSVACVTSKEPTDSEIGKLIYKILKNEIKADNRVTSALFAADRLDHILADDGLKDLIYNKRKVVLCDRYYMSSYAYQGVETELGWIMEINGQAVNELKPDCHIFIDITPELAMERLKSRTNFDIYEKLESLKKIYENYHRVIDMIKARENIVIIDGSKDLDEINDDIWKVIERMLQLR